MKLSNRELDILRLSAEGLFIKEVALELGIKESTVKTHHTNIFVKLGATNITHAVAIAITSGMIGEVRPRVEFLETLRELINQEERRML